MGKLNRAHLRYPSLHFHLGYAEDPIFMPGAVGCIGPHGCKLFQLESIDHLSGK